MIDRVQARVYIDTSIFLDAYEGALNHSEQLRLSFVTLFNKPKIAVTSEFTLAELFGRESARGWAWQKRFYLDLIVFNTSLDLRPVTRDILIDTGGFRRAARLQNRTVKLGDAIHTITAVRSECRYLFTCDKRFLVPRPMIRLLPDEQGFAFLQEILDA